jgi:general secretion pathway protein G
MVVILVLGMLAALVAPNIVQNVGTAKSAAARSQVELLGAALDAYRLDNDDYPTTEQGLAALREAPGAAPQPRNWRGPYLKKNVPLDPWGRAYLYRYPGLASSRTYELLTYGRDGVDGGAGEDADVRSWE